MMRRQSINLLLKDPAHDLCWMKGWEGFSQCLSGDSGLVTTFIQVSVSIYWASTLFQVLETQAVTKNLMIPDLTKSTSQQMTCRLGTCSEHISMCTWHRHVLHDGGLWCCFYSSIIYPCPLPPPVTPSPTLTAPGRQTIPTLGASSFSFLRKFNFANSQRQWQQLWKSGCWYSGLG